MNHAKIYSQAVSGNVDVVPLNPQVEVDNAIAGQQLAQWVANPLTQKHFSLLVKQSESCIDDALALATVNHQNNNSQLIVNKLLEANVLRKVVGKYGTK